MAIGATSGYEVESFADLTSAGTAPFILQGSTAALSTLVLNVNA